MRKVCLAGSLAVLVTSWLPAPALALAAAPAEVAPAEVPPSEAAQGNQAECRLGEKAPQCAQLQILYINDFHGQVTDERMVGDRPAGGAAYLAAHLQEREKAAGHTLLIGGGDLVGASAPVSSLLQDEPTLAVLGEMGMDLSVVGNHEFDEGLPELMRLIVGGQHEATGQWPGARFPYLAANVVGAESGEPILPPYQVFHVQGVPVGFIGVVTVQTSEIVTREAVQGLTFLDEAETVNRYVAELKEQGVEAIVAVVHEGGFWEKETGVTGEIVPIVERLDDEVDLVLSGHTHTRLQDRVDGKLVVQAYSSGTAFADVDLVLDQRTRDFADLSVEIVTTYQDQVEPDQKVARMVAAYAEEVAPRLNEVVATAAREITRTQNPAGESALGNLIADAQRRKMGTEFAFINPGGIRADLDAGEVTWGELYTIQPFNNYLVTMSLTGEQIYRLLNQQWQPGRTRFLQISGLEYSWSDALPEGSKVTEVRLAGGEPVDRSATYTVTANSFLAGGGDNFAVFTEATDQVVGPVDLDALVEYVQTLPQPFDAAITGRILKVD